MTSMEKIVFCNCAWMENYKGVTDEDIPQRNGKKIKDVDDVQESFNFFPHNHFCYGYLPNYPEVLPLERVENVGGNEEVIHGVTVVWMANRKIVGWYENADMFRRAQKFSDDFFSRQKHFHWIYNFKTEESNAYLIPVHRRNFKIPPKAKSEIENKNIWYADSEYAEKIFIPEVLSYLELIRKKCLPFYLTAEDFKVDTDMFKDLTYSQLEDIGEELESRENFVDALKIYNSMVEKTSDANELRELNYIRAELYEEIIFYDEAIDLYKKIINDYSGTVKLDNLSSESYWQLAIIYGKLNRDNEAEAAWTAIVERDDNFRSKVGALLCLMEIYEKKEDWKKMREAVALYDTWEDDENFYKKDVDHYRKILQEKIFSE